MNQRVGDRSPSERAKRVQQRLVRVPVPHELTSRQSPQSSRRPDRDRAQLRAGTAAAVFGVLVTIGGLIWFVGNVGGDQDASTSTPSRFRSVCPCCSASCSSPASGGGTGVLTESLRLARWAWTFPALMAVSIVAVTDYGLLSDVGGGMTLTLLGSALLVGIGEELMFRGIALEALRRVAGPLS